MSTHTSRPGAWTNAPESKAEVAAKADLRVNFVPAHRTIAHGRDESDPCQASTPGCAIDHTYDHGDCEGW